MNPSGPSLEAARTTNCWRRSAALALFASCCALATAQHRTGDQRVMEPPRAPAPTPTADHVEAFAETFRNVGQPRIVLMWDRELNDRTATAARQNEVKRETGRTSSGGLERTTQGDAETAGLRESDETFDRTTTITTSTDAVEERMRKNALEERHAVTLRKGFVVEMGRGNVYFVDRALAMRAIAADRHRGGADQKLIEVDALRSYADYLLEVLMVEDKDTPAGYGFDVRAKDLRSGQEVASLYSRAIPSAAAPAAPKWTATSQGYELRRAAQPPASPAEVGAALARDVMHALNGRLRTTHANTSRATR